MITTNTVEILGGPASSISLPVVIGQWGLAIFCVSLAVVASVVLLGVAYEIIHDLFFNKD